MLPLELAVLLAYLIALRLPLAGLLLLLSVRLRYDVQLVLLRYHCPLQPTDFGLRLRYHLLEHG